MAFTAPLHNIALPAGGVIPFGKFTIRDVPDWLRREPILRDISRRDRVATETCRQALVSEYEAHTYGHPDPDWKGQQPRGIQELRVQSAMLATMCIWMIMPSKICFTVCFHAFSGHAPFVNCVENGRTAVLPSERQAQCGNADRIDEGGRTLRNAFHCSTQKRHMASAASFLGSAGFCLGGLRYPLFRQWLESKAFSPPLCPL